MEKKFKELDEGFICRNCGKEVMPLLYTSRDHCPYCLYSIHVDNNPGDRAATCKGTLKPVGVFKYKDTFKIEYQCEKCHNKKVNIMARDDDMDKIIELSIVKD